MSVRFRLHMLMMFTPSTYSMLSAGVEWYDSSPPTTARPLEGTSSQEEVRREDDEILRQLQSTQTHISIWSLVASFSTH